MSRAWLPPRTKPRALVAARPYAKHHRAAALKAATAKRVRSWLHLRKSGTLTSVNLSNERDNFPLYGSTMPYVLVAGSDADPGLSVSPIIALRTDEAHYKHILNGERVSLVIYPIVPHEISPIQVPVPRANLTAGVDEIADPALIEAARRKFDVVHNAGAYVSGPGFVLFRLRLMDIFHVLCTQQMQHVQGSDLLGVRPDPVTIACRELLESVNAENEADLRNLILEYGDIRVSRAFAFHADADGIEVMGQVEGDKNLWHEFRIPLERPETDIVEFGLWIKRVLREVAAGRDTHGHPEKLVSKNDGMK